MMKLCMNALVIRDHLSNKHKLGTRPQGTGAQHLVRDIKGLLVEVILRGDNRLEQIRSCIINTTA